MGSSGMDGWGVLERASELFRKLTPTLVPMTPEEAALQMELLGHDFFFFTNADTGVAAVVYRRNDGDVGLIDAT